MSDMQSIFEKVAEVVQLHANAKQVYGEPVERDGTTVIPVARVQWGFGGGGLGRARIGQGGGGGGVRAIPTGYIEIRNGAAEYRPVRVGADVATTAVVAATGVIAGVMLAMLLRRG